VVLGPRRAKFIQPRVSTRRNQCAVLAITKVPLLTLGSPDIKPSSKSKEHDRLSRTNDGPSRESKGRRIITIQAGRRRVRCMLPGPSGTVGCDSRCSCCASVCGRIGENTERTVGESRAGSRQEGVGARHVGASERGRCVGAEREHGEAEENRRRIKEGIDY